MDTTSPTTTPRRAAPTRLALSQPQPPALRLGFEPSRVPALLAEARVEQAVAMAAHLAHAAPHLLHPHLHALPVQAAAQDPALLADLLRSSVHASDHPTRGLDLRRTRRPWTGPFTVLVQDLLHQKVTPPVILTLAPVWPVLLSYRGPAQREQLTFHLARDVLAPRAWRIRGSVVRGLLAEFEARQLHKNALLAKLAVLAYADSRALDMPEVRRFLEHRRICRDGRRLRTVINFVLSTERLDRLQAANLIRRVLGHEGASEAGPAQSARDVRRAYGQETVPQVLELCELYAAYLRLGLSLRDIDPAKRTDAATLRDAIAHVLLGPADAALEPQLRAQLDGWRVPVRLLTFAGQLRCLDDDGAATALLQRVLRLLAEGSYAQERAGSVALEPLAHAQRAAWTAGASRPLSDLSLPEALSSALPAGWTAEDGCSAEDFINSGADVQGSCQSVEGDPTYSQTLLGRMLDGSKRLVMIKDETGEMVARAMFRLLTSARGGPVLLVSRPYVAPAITPAQARKVLAIFARQRARALQVPLVGPRGVYTSAMPWTSDLHAAPSLGLDYWDELDGGENSLSRQGVTLAAEELRTLLPRGLW